MLVLIKIIFKYRYLEIQSTEPHLLFSSFPEIQDYGNSKYSVHIPIFLIISFINRSTCQF